jgi:HEAT repeat protein
MMMRIGGLQGLATVAGKDAVKPLREAAGDSDTKVQAAAIKFLAGVPGPEVTAAMIEDLPKLAVPGRVRMVTALAHRGDRAAAPVILKSASDEAIGVRIAALDGLGVISEPSSVSMLAERASSTTLEEPERAAARSALDRMRGESVDAAIVSGIGSAATPVKIELIRSTGERGIQKAADVLLASVKDSDRNVRREAFRALRETAGAGQVSPLLELLLTTKSQSERREVERALSSALRRSPPELSKDVVAAYEKTEAADLRSSLLQVMGQAGTSQVLPVLRAATKDSNPDIVRGAILGLTDWPGEEPMKDLLALAGETQSASHRILALRGFLNLVQLPSARPAEETVGMLATAMKLSNQPDEKKAILGLLPRYPAPQGLELAKSATADPAVENEAKMAVQRLERTLRPR